MGAFISREIGGERVGVWASNRERDALLDWFAAHRCRPGDERWAWCKDAAQRWPGRCIDLSELLGPGERFEVTDAEAEGAAREYGPGVARLLRLAELIWRGQWAHTAGSAEAVRWRTP